MTKREHTKAEKVRLGPVAESLAKSSFKSLDAARVIRKLPFGEQIVERKRGKKGGSVLVAYVRNALDQPTSEPRHQLTSKSEADIDEYFYIAEEQQERKIKLNGWERYRVNPPRITDLTSLSPLSVKRKRTERFIVPDHESVRRGFLRRSDA